MAGEARGQGACRLPHPARASGITPSGARPVLQVHGVLLPEPSRCSDSVRRPRRVARRGRTPEGRLPPLRPHARAAPVRGRRAPRPSQTGAGVRTGRPWAAGTLDSSPGAWGPPASYFPYLSFFSFKTIPHTRSGHPDVRAGWTAFPDLQPRIARALAVGSRPQAPRVSLSHQEPGFFSLWPRLY